MRATAVLLLAVAGLAGCSAPQKSSPSAVVLPRDAEPPGAVFPVMLGIDVLEAEGFSAVVGKRIGLLTHPAGVNRAGESTIDVLRRARGVRLVALYGPEHGIDGKAAAEKYVPSSMDARTGLPVFSLYDATRKATPAMLKDIDAMVIDLQDIGTRSYTYVSAMRRTMEACFENGVEVIVLDRPNPLGGLKISGPPLDANLMSYVGLFRVPYVHGMTIGELARMAKEAPGVLDVTEQVRAAGRLQIIPMRGWNRSMRWPDTGLKFVATSPFIQDFNATLGYGMTGLGTYFYPTTGFDIGFRHGVGKAHPFLALTHKTVRSEVLEADLRALNIPGLSFQRIMGTGSDNNPTSAVLVQVSDWEKWDPTELSFHLMRLGARYAPRNPFDVPLASAELFLKHMGSTAFFQAIKANGAQVNLAAWLETWRTQAKVSQQEMRKYWLYQ